MKAFLVVFWLAGLALAGNAADPVRPAAAAAPVFPGPVTTDPNGAVAAPAASPRITFATPIYDFGKIKGGEVLKYDYVFTNSGNALLEISAVRPGCGCTTAGTWDRQIEPGQTGKIPIQFSASSASGPVTKSITVTCNDPTQPSVFLQIKGTVWMPITVNPASAYFNIPSDAETNETKVIHIVSNLEEPLTLQEPECTNRAFRVELKTVKAGKEFDLLVTAVQPLAVAYVNAPITIKSSSPSVPVVTVPAIAIVQPAVSVVPSVVMLPATLGPAGAQAMVNIRNTGANPLVLSEPTIDLSGAEMDVKEVQTGRLFRVTFKIPANADLKPGQRFEASLKSNNPKFPVIKVPIIRPSRPPGPAAGTTPAPNLTPITRPATTVPAGTPGAPKPPALQPSKVAPPPVPPAEPSAKTSP